MKDKSWVGFLVCFCCEKCLNNSNQFFNKRIKIRQMLQTKHLTLHKLPNAISLQVFNKSNNILPIKWLPGFGFFAYPTCLYKCFLVFYYWKFVLGTVFSFLTGKKALNTQSKKMVYNSSSGRSFEDYDQYIIPSCTF